MSRFSRAIVRFVFLNNAKTRLCQSQLSGTMSRAKEHQNSLRLIRRIHNHLRSLPHRVRAIHSECAKWAFQISHQLLQRNDRRTPRTRETETISLEYIGEEERRANSRNWVCDSLLGEVASASCESPGSMNARCRGIERFVDVSKRRK